MTISASIWFFLLMIRRPPRSTLDRSSAASDVYKRQAHENIKGGIATWHLMLTPKTATNYKNAELWVDGDGFPVQAKITENNTDFTTVLLENIRKNITLAGTVFKLQYPSSAKKIKA